MNENRLGPLSQHDVIVMPGDLLNPRRRRAVVDIILRADGLRPDRRKRFDAVDDLHFLVRLAVELPGGRSPPGPAPDSTWTVPRLTWSSVVLAGADLLHRHNPAYSLAEWALLYWDLLRARPGYGESMRIRNRPKLGKLADAWAGMTVAQLMRKWGISRRQAFNLRKQALTKK